MNQEVNFPVTLANFKVTLESEGCTKGVEQNFQAYFISLVVSICAQITSLTIPNTEHHPIIKNKFSAYSGSLDRAQA